MPGYAEMMKRQWVLADFGEFALHSDNLDEVLSEACRLVGEALGTGRAKILEIQDDGQWLDARRLGSPDPPRYASRAGGATEILRFNG